MFTSVLGALTSALPNFFVWGAYMPVLIFSFVNCGLVYVLSATGRAWLQQAIGTNSPLTLGAAFVFTVAGAYVVSSINDLLREMLEGRHLAHIPFVAFLLAAQQQAHRITLQGRYLRAVTRRYELRERKSRWERALALAASYGLRNHPKNRGVPAYDQNGPTARQVTSLRHQSFTPSRIRIAEIEQAVLSMVRELRGHDKTVDVALATDHKALLLLIDTIFNTALSQEFDAALELNMSFSGDRPAPTRMGNVADAMHGYTMKRYGIDLNVLMSRLQTTLLRSGDKSYSMMLDAKTQLDFLVACCCFSGFTTVAWSGILIYFHGATSAYLVVTVGGALLTWLLYAVATESYRAYSVSVRACVDVNRFMLLRALELTLPTTLNSELRLWRTLSESAVSGNAVELSYDHARPSP